MFLISYIQDEDRLHRNGIYYIIQLHTFIILKVPKPEIFVTVIRKVSTKFLDHIHIEREILWARATHRLKKETAPLRAVMFIMKPLIVGYNSVFLGCVHRVQAVYSTIDDRECTVYSVTRNFCHRPAGFVHKVT